MKIQKIESVHFRDYPNITLLELTSEDGAVGLGETYYTPRTVQAYIAEALAPQLLSTDPLDIEGFWRNAYDASHVYGNRGVELRALSAVDVALWDLLGQACGKPIVKVLGGSSHPKGVPIYNTCASPGYAQGTPGVPRREGEAGKGVVPERLRAYDDYRAWNSDAGALARSLLEDGFSCMKIWPFDPFALANRGHSISLGEIERGLEPVRRIRDAVGEKMEIIIEGHGYWSLAAARRIARALEPFRIALLEDLVKPDRPRTLAMLRESTEIPICASELLLGRYAVEEIIEARAADVIMTDATWCGGISEARKIAAMAEAQNLAVIFHDCTGPATLAASLHLSAHAPNTYAQEVVRAYIHGSYRELVEPALAYRGGRMDAPSAPGLGVRIRPESRQRADCAIARLG